MPTELLTASEAARRLGSRLGLWYASSASGEIRYVMLDGIAHIPEEALDEYRAQAS